jgi:hypothetical protein
MPDTANRYLIEEQMMGWIIESNHLVDALLAQAGEKSETRFAKLISRRRCRQLCRKAESTSG